MELRDKILAYMKELAYKPLSAEELAEILNVKGDKLTFFWQVLNELESNADIIKTRYDKYGLPERMNLAVGRFEATSKGFGFVITDNPDEDDIFIPPHSMMSAMNNDRVVVRVQHRPVGKRAEGEVIRIVRRANTKIVGTLTISKAFGFVIPDDKRIGQDIFIAKEDVNGARNGQKVVVEIVHWPEGRKSAEGKIIEILGFKGDPGIEILSIIKQHDLPLEFPKNVKIAASRVPEKISAEEIEGRRDLRDVLMVTIDSEDARDLDDAVHVKRLENGNYLLGVHIADVSYYVKENGVLDNEAKERGTSVYLVDRVLPMLPPKLSNGICSLNAREDRLALSAHMEINDKGRVLKYELFPSIIKVHTRLSYNIVRAILADKDTEFRNKYDYLVPQLEEMEQLCSILRKRRVRRGAIDFDFPEQKVKLDETGRPIEIIQRVRSIAESIIEEFMLVANETVAEHMSKLNVPFIFRVHEEPEMEKISKLNNLLNNFGLQLAQADEVKPMVLQKVLEKIAGRPEERIISTVMLRSLKQARYEAENLGHFGLAASYYTHFTSPIRRYPDLIVHRLLRESWQSGKLNAKRRQKLTVILPEIAHHSSVREREAAEAERDTVELKKVEYMAQFIGEKFEGHISGVAAYGMFVELKNGVEGLVHVSSMDDDYYQYAEEQYALIGERTKKVYRLGDVITIEVAGINAEERTIDFVLEGQAGSYVPRSKEKKTEQKDDRGTGKPRDKKTKARRTGGGPTRKPRAKRTKKAVSKKKQRK